MTGARTGHAGTLDPFATGLLLVLSGRATKIASRLVGLDKRYVTDVDLTARTSTGDPEGEVVERLEPPDAADLEQIAYTGEVVTLDIRVSSGTYVRAIAEALGGHCRALRRTEVGPFSVTDAVPPEAFEPRLLLAEAEVLERVGAPA